MIEQSRLWECVRPVTTPSEQVELLRELNTAEQHMLRNGRGRLNLRRTSIGEMCVWSYTPQGDAYWRAWDQKLMERASVFGGPYSD